MSHTPGPWKREPYDDGDEIWQGDGGLLVCTCEPHNPGNARLIEAAPDMKRLLQEWARTWTTRGSLREVQKETVELLLKLTGEGL